MPHRLLNTECKPPFEKDGEEYRSYLCTVGNDNDLPYYVFVYARNNQEAKDVLDLEHQKYYKNREVITHYDE